MRLDRKGAWESEEDDRLIDLYNSGEGVAAIARKLPCRSTGAVRARLTHLAREGRVVTRRRRGHGRGGS